MNILGNYVKIERRVAVQTPGPRLLHHHVVTYLTTANPKQGNVSEGNLRTYGAKLWESRKRNLNFSYREIEILVDEVVERYDILLGRLARRTPLSQKTYIWKGILKKANAVGVECRTVKCLKKKWYHLRRHTKQKLERIREYAEKTGESPQANLKLDGVKKNQKKLRELAILI
ncbi:nuclear apoptosis-inducing factor 1-like [Hyla sarda]|uniref:nuclear apoptosis-inducing factor 1-like n=1 Tax=Hyla sarda TaxID=327740 RepID=UPI0024C275BF|nr:nuclear apoptosis-inducing factor 1-like [Hyla sarda]